MADVLVDSLRAQRYEVEWADSAEEGWSRLRHYTYDLIVMDWNMPGMTGVELCKQFRQSGGNTPVILLTARAHVIDKERGLDCGADDYLTKPFEPRELHARIRALLRRPGTFAGDTIQIDDIVLDTTSQSVTRAGVPVKLIPREFALLHFLMKHPNQVFSIEALQERVWSNDSDASPSAVRKCIERLRKKLDRDGEAPLIETLYGVGYMLKR